MEEIKIINLDEGYEKEDYESKNVWLKKRFIINKIPSEEWIRKLEMKKPFFCLAGLLPIGFDTNKAELDILSDKEKAEGKKEPEIVNYLVFRVDKEDPKKSLHEQTELIKKLTDEVNSL